MRKTNATGNTCVGDLRLMAIDIGFDLRTVGKKIRLPDDFSSVGLDGRDGQSYLCEGTREEMIAAIKDAGYEIAQITD